VKRIQRRLPRAAILLLALIVPAAVIAYYLHNPAWLIGSGIAGVGSGAVARRHMPAKLAAPVIWQ
jgi:hypothetical protein